MSTNKAVKLDKNESIVLRQSFVAMDTFAIILLDELILTTKNIVFNKRGLFGETWKISKYPLDKIVVANGEPQVCYRRDHGKNIIDVHMVSGQVSFVFFRKKTAKAWINKIKELVETKPALRNVTRYCNRCGASVSGKVGESVKCPFCGTFVPMDE